MVPVALSRRAIAATFCLVLLAASGLVAPAEESTPAATVDAFHDALRRGDAKAAMELLAPDAMILESGSAETRAEYERHHLQEDIEFARAVSSVRSVLNAQIDGNVAWIMSTTRTTGTFHEREVDSAGVELMVLSKSPKGWRIRTVHWSSHKTKPNK
jgi:ketosteroid isomerase-like protein